MGTSLWTVFCGNRAGFGIAETHLTGFWVIFNPFSCTNHGVIIGADILFTCFSLYLLLRKQTSSSDTTTSGQFRKILSVSSAVFNGCLSISYMAFGVWFLVDKLTEGESLSPLHEWLVILFQGLSWLLLTLTLCLKKNPFTSPFTMKIWSILALVYACFLCIPSLWFSVAYKEVSVKLVADVLSLPGSVLLLLLAFFKSRPEYDGNDGLLEPLLEGTEEENEENVSPFAKAGVLSKLTFWWLNPLMKKGKEKTIEDDDIPQLRSEDRARTCYSVFTQMLNRKRKASEAVANSLPILSTIFSWQSKPILTTAFFALIKVLATSASPLLLKEFIEVAEGNKTFANEGYLLTATLFLVKCIESLSERQWLFRTRIIGIQIRSALSAAIYQKQLRLSSSSNITSSEIVSLVTIDAYRIGEFPASFHQIWTTSLQLCLALLILYYCIGLGAVAAIIVVLLTLVGNSPLAKLQTKYRRNFMEKQDRMVQYIAESLSTMKVLKLYAWEMHFKRVIEGLRQDEYEWIKAVSLQSGYNLILFWAAPVLVPVAAFGACYFLGIELTNAKVFTFLASLRLVQEPVRQLPDVVGAFIDAKVALSRIVGFLEAPEIQRSSKVRNSGEDVAICINAKGISWEDERGSVRPNLRDIKLIVRRGEKVAVCGEVGAGKSTLLASILGEVPYVDGSVQANGSLAYVSQNAWIQTGTIQDNILFGSPMDATRYQEALSKCSLTKDLEMLPYGDLTVIGERGVNLSGGQKQRIQLARALYQNADIYLLDDPFSAVDAHTATSLFTEYVMEALAEKTLLLVTHQVDFLPAFNSILLMSDGKIQATSTYHQLLATSDAFNSFVHAHHDSNSVGGLEIEISKISAEPEIQTTTAAAQQLILGDQLIQKEAKDTGDTGYKPYLDYLRHGKGFLYFALASCIHAFFILGQFAQNVWLAVNLQSSSTSQLVVVEVYALIGCGLIVFLVGRSIFIVLLGLGASKSIFSVLINSLFKAPMFFYDSTPLGRILSRVSSDLSTVDIDIPMRMTIALGTTMNSYLCLCILAVLSWEVVFLIIPLVYLAILLQRYYFSAAKELMRINGTTKSTLSSHAAETAAGNITIRAFGKEDKFFAQNLDLIDKNASPYLHSFAANEWLIQRLDLICTIVLSATALFMTVIQDNTSSGFVGMALSYGLSLNMFLTTSVQSQCTLANMMVSVERLEQYMHIPSEAPEIIATNRPSPLWPNAGRVEILNLKVRYRPNSPLVLKGISCVIEGGHKVGIVGRTGSGKTTLISTLFRLVEPTEGHIIIDGLDISTIGLHDLRSCFGVIPQDPTLFGGSVRYNLDPLHEHTDHEIWQVLEKCQLREAVKEKSEGLSSFVVQDGSNWSMGQRQLFCLGRALLKKRKILVLDEATASIDNATDAIIQRAIRTEFDSSTVITVAHRIPTVLDSTMVLAMSDGRLVEYDEPSKLMNEETSMFGQLVREYWAQTGNAATG